MIDQLEEKYSALDDIWQSEEEWHDTNHQYKQFVVDEFVLYPIREAVLYWCNNHFDDGKL